MIKQEKKNQGKKKDNGCKLISTYDQKVLDTKDKKKKKYIQTNKYKINRAKETLVQTEIDSHKHRTTKTPN